MSAASKNTVTTVVALAKRFDVARNTVHEWIRNGLPRRPDGSFDLAAVEAWVDARRSGDDDADLADWKRRKARADALRAEDELARNRGEMISRLEHERWQVELVTSFVTALEAMPAKLTPVLVAARGFDEIDAALHAHIRALRVQLAAKHTPRPQEMTEESPDDAEDAPDEDS